MLRPILLSMALSLASLSSAGVIGVGGSSGVSADQLQNLPELMVHPAVYEEIRNRLYHEPTIQAHFRGESMELTNIRMNDQDNVVETQLRLKLKPQY